MPTLENSMLGAFGGEKMSDGVRLLYLSLSCGGVSLIIIDMAVCVMRQGGKNLKSK